MYTHTHIYICIYICSADHAGSGFEQTNRRDQIKMEDYLSRRYVRHLYYRYPRAGVAVHHTSTHLIPINKPIHQKQKKEKKQEGKSSKRPRHACLYLSQAGYACILYIPTSLVRPLAASGHPPWTERQANTCGLHWRILDLRRGLVGAVLKSRCCAILIYNRWLTCPQVIHVLERYRVRCAWKTIHIYITSIHTLHYNSKATSY